MKNQLNRKAKKMLSVVSIHFIHFYLKKYIVNNKNIQKLLYKKKNKKLKFIKTKNKKTKNKVKKN